MSTGIACVRTVHVLADKKVVEKQCTLGCVLHEYDSSSKNTSQNCENASNVACTSIINSQRISLRLASWPNTVNTLVSSSSVLRLRFFFFKNYQKQVVLLLMFYSNTIFLLWCSRHISSIESAEEGL